MLRAILRFLIISHISFLNGLVWVLFDRGEITGIEFYVVEQKSKKKNEQDVLLKHLKKCQKQVYKKEK